MIKQLIMFTMMLFLVAGCSKENELKKSVLVYDTEYTDLPAYSEWGYNTFGAYYDREVFISNNQKVPAKVIVRTNETSFMLDGQNGAYHYYNYDVSSGMSMTFKLSGFAPGDYTNLTVLNDTTLDLTSPDYKVSVTIDTLEYPASILSGELTFKRAQNLLVDKKQIEVILSGYFDFKAVINGKPVTVSNGRFDVGINADNFYRY